MDFTHYFGGNIDQVQQCTLCTCLSELYRSSFELKLHRFALDIVVFFLIYNALELTLDSEEELTDSEVFRHKPPKNKPPYGNYGQGSVPKCSRYEEYSSCGPLCEDDCSNKCQGQATGCKKGCFCKNGYVRHSTGSCIPIASCLSKYL